MKSNWQLSAITNGYLADPYDPFSPDGRYLVIPKRWTHSLAVYDRNLRWFEVARCVGHAGQLTGLKVTADGTKIVSFSRRLPGSGSGGRASFLNWGDGSVIVWNLTSGEQLFRLDHEYLWHCLFSDDGRYLCTGSPSRIPCLQVWDSAERAELTQFHRPLDRAKGFVAICPRGKCVATRADTGGVDVWSLPDAKLLFSTSEAASPFTHLPPGAISSDGRLLAYCRDDQLHVDLWDLVERRWVTSIPVHGKEPRYVWFSRDSSRLFIGQLKETGRLGCVDTGAGHLAIYQVKAADRHTCFDPWDGVIIRSSRQHCAEMLHPLTTEPVGVVEGPQYLESPNDCPDGVLWGRGGVSLSLIGDLLLCAGNLTVSVWSRQVPTEQRASFR